MVIVLLPALVAVEQAGWSLGICEQAGHEEPLGFGSPWAALLVEEKRRAKGAKTLDNVGGEGHREVWVVDCWAEFFNLSFFLFLRKSPHPVSSFLWDLQFWQKSVFNLAVHIKILTV